MINERIIIINPNKMAKKIGGIVEGGMARNNAVMNYAIDHNYKLYNVSTNKLLSTLQVYFLLLTSRKNAIVFLYCTVGVPLSNTSRVGRKIANTFIRLVNRASRDNYIVFDISDLKYEQALDLDLENGRREVFRDVEKKIMCANARYIFTSESMREYAIKKYHIPSGKTCCHLNGGYITDAENGTADNENKAAENSKADENIKYIYTGSLNRGRNIERMINVFLKCHKNLSLMGKGGDWINIDYAQYPNIKYLGEFQESEARKITAGYDVGLIPYDSSKLYYNLAYPIKLPFYICCGLPFLSTDVREAKKALIRYPGIGFAESFDKWEDIINTLDRTIVNSMKNKVKTCRNSFSWDNTLQGYVEYVGR